MPNKIEVRTKEELKTAQENKANEIHVVGELADKLKKSKKVAMLGTAGLTVITAMLGTAVVMTPATGGLSMGFVAPAAALTGVEIAAIIAAASLGIALILAIFKDYEEISYGKGSLTLRKKQR